LIEKSTMFEGERIAFVASNNMPNTNTTSLTTIVSLYDILTILFTKMNFEQRRRLAELKTTRPSDRDLNAYFSYAKRFFVLLRKHFAELDEFFGCEDNTNAIVSKYRGSHGGNALFRPIGLDVFIQIIAKLNVDHSLIKSIRLASRLPRNLTEPPYAGLMWNTSTSTIVNAHIVTLREVLLYMLGDSKFSDKILLARYRKDTGDENAELPEVVV
jgi:DNA sulfur modification protein DndB